MTPAGLAAPARLRNARRLVVILRVGFFVAVGFVLLRAALHHADQLRTVDLHAREGWLGMAALLAPTGGILVPLAWRHLVAAYGPKMKVVDALWAWSASQAARYLPTGAATIPTRVVVAGRSAVPASTAATTTVIEIVLLVAWQTLIAGGLLPSSTVPLPLRLSLIAPTALVLAALPWLAARGHELLPRTSPEEPHRSRLAGAVAAYGASIAIRIIAAGCFAAALLPARWSDAFLLLGAISGAAIVGLLGITPGGIGLREGALAAMLSSRFGVGDAAAMAVALRAWEFAIELLWLGVSAVISRRRTASVPELTSG